MSFASYAQNFEDVMLWRALKHIDQGFYIDIGAQDPVVDSVSFAFYQQGWRGVHIEPTQQYSTKLKKARPDETVEQVAIGNSVGSITLYEFEGTGLSTAVPEIASKHKADGYVAIEIEVTIVTMDALLDRHGYKNIHWLKIDVEGYEKEVLESWRESMIRPWILVIESTEPLTQEQNHDKWQDIVLKKGYNFAYYDGLNRFYVHSDHSDLLPLFSAPPNVFDDFVLSGTSSQPFYRLIANQAQEAELRTEEAEAKVQVAHAKAQEAETRAKMAEADAQESHAKIQEAHAKAQEAETRAKMAEADAREVRAKMQEAETRAAMAEAALAIVYNSHSWRITAPLRDLGFVLRWFIRGTITWLTFAPGCSPRRISRNILISIKYGIATRPWLKVVVTRLLSPFPQLVERIRSICKPYLPFHANNITSKEDSIESIENLSPNARKIYFELNAAIEEQRQKEKADAHRH
ncbi:FkbM family methyltransferase [Candidatus Parcubacteria bacterium]|nr:MAG: FkbM family methyltransferase [Candidatus Parcubacteria bacterium]